MKITICACSSRTFIDRTEVAKLAASAKQAGMEVTLVNDLCELWQYWAGCRRAAQNPPHLPCR